MVDNTIDRLDSNKSRTSRRRNFIRGLGIATTALIAGCTSDDGGDGSGSGDGGDGSGSGDGGDGGDGGTTTGGSDLETFTNEAGVEVGATWEAVQELAKEEDGVLGYIAEDQSVLDDQYKPAFKEAYPDIDVELVGSNASEAYNRFHQEYQGGADTADMVEVSSQGVTMIERGQAMEISPDYLPSLKDYDDQYIGDAYIATRMKIGCLMYNTDMVSDGEVPTSFNEVASDDKWADQNIGWDPTPLYPLMASIRDREGDEFFDKLANQRPRWVDSHTDLARFCGAGQFPVAFTFLSKFIQFKDLPMEVIKTDYVPSSPIMQLISNKASSPNQALILSNWWLREEGMNVVGNTGNFPTRPNVELDWISEDLYPGDWEIAATNYQDFDRQGTIDFWKEAMGDQIGQ